MFDPAAMAKLTCSIDMEPRTLKPGQMHHEREVAVGIFQKMEPVELSNVLIIQGKRQVISTEMDQIVESTDEELHQAVEDMTLGSIGRSQHCSCINPITEEPVDHGGQLREPHTAPF